MTKSEDTWPDKIVYVCSATGAAPVNMVPLRHAGERVTGLVVLVAAKQERDQNSPGELREAFYPMERIIAYAQAAGLTEDRIDVVFGDGNSFGRWETALGNASRLATDGETIVFNVSGGRTLMRLAPVQGWNRLSTNAGLRLLSVDQPDGQARLIDISGDAGVEQQLGFRSTGSLDDYLESLGLEEVDREGREAAERWGRAKEQQDAVAYITQRANPMQRSKMLRALHSLVGRRMPQDDKSRGPTLSQPLRFQLESDEWRRVSPRDAVSFRDRTRNFLSRIDDVTVTGNNVETWSRRAAEFMQGIWFEFYLARCIEEGLSKAGIPENRKPKVFRGLKIRSRHDGGTSSPAQTGEWTDFDVVVFGADSTILIEAKAGVDTRKFHESLSKLSAYRKAMCNPLRNAYFVAPHLSADGKVLANLRQHAAHDAITFITKWSDIHDVMVRDICDHFSGSVA